jgi:hypothetical protein
MRIDHAAFFNAYRDAYGRPSQSTLAGIELLGGHMEKDTEITDLRWAAYMLATVKHECANTWLPITEKGVKTYFDKYETGTPIGKRLGNTETGDGWKFRGRGFVQITGRANYARMTTALGLGPDENLVNDPEQALRPAIAYRIMSVGMRKGLFTGKKLSDYINANGCDYKNARQIINGLDQWELIKGYAETLEGVLRSAIVQEVAPTSDAFDANAVNLENIKQIDGMNPGALYLVKSLLMECQRDQRNTYLRLHDATPGGHVVQYAVVRGDPQLVLRIANALGFKSVTASTLEVRSE